MAPSAPFFIKLDSHAADRLLAITIMGMVDLLFDSPAGNGMARNWIIAWSNYLASPSSQQGTGRSVYLTALVSPSEPDCKRSRAENACYDLRCKWTETS